MATKQHQGDVEAIFRYNVPDPNITADDRALFALAAPKTVQEIKLPLHDIRTADLPGGRECLDKHGFTVINDPQPETIFSNAEAIEREYIPVLCELVKSATGCKKVLVNNVAFRRKAVNAQADPMFYHKKGGDFDKLGRSMPTDRPFGESIKLMSRDILMLGLQ